MSKDDVGKLLTVMSATYSNLHFTNPELALETWWRILKADDPEPIMDAFYRYARTNTSGFAPSPGQLHMMIADKVVEQDSLSDGEVMHILMMASRNGNYGAQDEFQKMPEDLRRAVGSPAVIRSWGAMELDKLEYEHNRVLRSYRSLRTREKANMALRGFKKEDMPFLETDDEELLEDNDGSEWDY